MDGVTVMETGLFSAFRDVALREAGIQLGPAKRSLVHARVGARLRALGLRSARQYLARLQADRTGDEMRAFLDVIATHHTGFFREPEHFDLLGETLQSWAAAGQRRFRLWCAAASTGEEPWTMALVAAQKLAPWPVDARILATDLSVRTLLHTLDGKYGETRLTAVPATLRERHFAATGATSQDGPVYAVDGSLRRLLTVKQLNLARTPFPMKGPLDVILCRNVMIYLAQEVRQGLVAEAERLLRPGGLLMVGHAETLSGLRHGLQLLKPSVYVRPEGR